MSGYRQIHTRIWTDAWFMELPALHKLLYVYLFSNERASVCGLYELPLRVIAFETGYDISVIRSMLEDFRVSDKIEYDFEHSVVWVKNMAKYQASSSPKLQTRIQSDIRVVPNCTVKEHFNMVSIWYPSGTDTSISSRSISVSVSESKEDLNENCYKLAYVNYTNNFGALTSFIADSIKSAVDDYTAEWVNEAMNEAVRNEARKWNYVEAILKRWKTDGFKSQKKGGNGKNPQPNKPASTPILVEKDWHP